MKLTGCLNAMETRRRRIALEYILQKLRNKRGETLLELIVSVAILAILSLAFVSLLMGATNFNTKANRVYKEDTQINAKFEGDDFALIVPATNTAGTAGYPKPPMKFYKADGSDFTILMEGKYETATGKAGERVILKRFVPS